MFPGHAKWKRSLPIPICLDRSGSIAVDRPMSAGQLATVEMALEEYNSRFYELAARINDYIVINQVNRELVSEELFKEVSDLLISSQAETGVESQQGINLKGNDSRGPCMPDLTMSGSGMEAHLIYILLHLNGTPEYRDDDTVVRHELGHCLNARHTYTVNSVMNSSTGPITEDDMRSIAVHYTAPFEADIRYQTLDDVPVDPPTAVFGWLNM